MSTYDWWLSSPEDVERGKFRMQGGEVVASMQQLSVNPAADFLKSGTYAIIAVDTDTMGIEFITVADAGEVVDAIADDHASRMNDLDNGYDPMCVDEYRIFFASGTAFNGSAIALVTP